MSDGAMTCGCYSPISLVLGSDLFVRQALSAKRAGGRSFMSLTGIGGDTIHRDEGGYS